jgi:hypothetical protein
LVVMFALMGRDVKMFPRKILSVAILRKEI